MASEAALDRWALLFGVVSFFAPFGCLLLSCFWVSSCIHPGWDPGMSSWSVPEPWRGYGLSEHMCWMMGIYIALASGAVGLTAVVLGIRAKRWGVLAVGIWAILASPVLAFLYMVATF